jgi:hypothetical protein
MNPDDQPLSKSAVSFGFAVVIASVINALLVIGKETSPAIMRGLWRLSGHHWVSHAVIVIVLFVVLGWLFRGLRTTSASRLIGSLIGGVVLSSLIIVGFYLIGD